MAELNLVNATCRTQNILSHRESLLPVPVSPDSIRPD